MWIGDSSMRLGKFWLSLIVAVLVNPAFASEELLEELASIATPPGITLQPLGKAQGYALDKDAAARLVRERIAYTDISGMTLYFNDFDSDKVIFCVDECAIKWPPAAAPTYAKPFGDWSVVDRPNGSKQWAFKGKPLYTYSEDIGVGAIAGHSAYLLARGPNAGPRGAYRGERPKEQPLPDGWHAALLYPASDVILPPGISIKDISDALGIVLVGASGQTLYVFGGDINKEEEVCGDPRCDWRPLAAPQLAASIGNFDFIIREDGIRQWTYKGLPLYSYGKDYAPGDAFGIGVHSDWHAAYTVRYYKPSNVLVGHNPMLGKVMSTTKGQTLYKRDGYIFASGGGHGLRHGAPNRPAVGRDIGINARCVVECEKWNPFLAPADANPRGNWDVTEREDGSKQWVYRGFALWTYSGDLEPGSVNAHDSYDIVLSSHPSTVVDIGTPYDGVGALYWSAVFP
ncbi:MAG: hypothetical protein CMG46_04135 [Candidatus Marinimicrobia bacterium]|nr:hypothetical protein [Candidatus Neomarinimicrobiota bacterium]